jgi:hypothetical protein
VARVAPGALAFGKWPEFGTFGHLGVSLGPIISMKLAALAAKIGPGSALHQG